MATSQEKWKKKKKLSQQNPNLSWPGWRIKFRNNKKSALDHSNGLKENILSDSIGKNWIVCPERATHFKHFQSLRLHQAKQRLWIETQQLKLTRQSQNIHLNYTAWHQRARERVFQFDAPLAVLFCEGVAPKLKRRRKVTRCFSRLFIRHDERNPISHFINALGDKCDFFCLLWRGCARFVYRRDEPRAVWPLHKYKFRLSSRRVQRGGLTGWEAIQQNTQTTHTTALIEQNFDSQVKSGAALVEKNEPLSRLCCDIVTQTSPCGYWWYPRETLRPLWNAYFLPNLSLSCFQVQKLAPRGKKTNCLFSFY